MKKLFLISILVLASLSIKKIYSQESNSPKVRESQPPQSLNGPPTTPFRASPQTPPPHHPPMGQNRPPNPLQEWLLPPEAYMLHQGELNKDQKEKIIQLLKKFQSEVVNSEWKLNELRKDIENLLPQFPLNEKIIVEKTVELGQIESEMKSKHISLLIQLRNLLTKEQFERIKQNLISLRR